MKDILAAKRAEIVRLRAERKLRFNRPEVRHAIAVQDAMGMTTMQIAQSLQITRTQVQLVRANPDIQQLTQELRQAVRLVQQQSVMAQTQQAWTRASEALTAADARSYDAYMRGLAAMEKISASAAGEHKPASIQIANVNAPTLDGKAALAGVLSDIFGTGVVLDAEAHETGSGSPQ